MSNLIITGGTAPSMLPPLSYDKIFAVDSGYDKAVSLGLAVDEVFGDLDSTHFRDKLIDMGIKPLSRDKDCSDTEYALSVNQSAVYDLFGGGGGRIDHLLGVMALFHSYPLPRFWFTGEDLLISCESTISLRVKKGSDISIFSARGEKCHLHSEGLKWPLDGLELSSSFLSLSNRAESEVVTLKTDNSVFIRVDIEYLPTLDNMVI